MKRNLTLISGALFLGASAASVAATAVDVWATAVSTQAVTGRQVIFRFAKTFHQGFQTSDFPLRVILVWQYQSESGMPSTAEREDMDRMEDLLQSYVGSSSILALVSTGENMREWVFYARSEEQFLMLLNMALADAPHFPIEIHAAPDPDWFTYEGFRSGVIE
ncbi:DUF695 domain-containing protein [Vogesella facilis]|uniref:DUF695 domain-containing protein n=1 Tax=Vogesella facilis TaxID=1655232 RepID=A0ABV7R9B3_9NEIS